MCGKPIVGESEDGTCNPCFVIHQRVVMAFIGTASNQERADLALAIIRKPGGPHANILRFVERYRDADATQRTAMKRELAEMSRLAVLAADTCAAMDVPPAPATFEA